MKSLRFGLKISFDDTQYTLDIVDLIKNSKLDYIELFVKPDCNLINIRYWSAFNIPIVLHAPHSGVGINFASKENREINKETLNKLSIIATNLKPEYIIFHAGLNNDYKETVIQLKEFTNKYNCLIENKPAITKDIDYPVGVEYEELGKLLEALTCEFCLDIGHAICAANYFHIDRQKFINRLLELEPIMFHITDCYCNTIIDNHSNFGKGNLFINFPNILDIIPDNSMVTIETTNDKDSLKLFEKDRDYLWEKLVYSK
jgi:endonuclease IV